MKQILKNIEYVLILFFCLTSTLVAQNQAKEKSARMIDISGVVVGEDNMPLKNVKIFSNAGDIITPASEDGWFSVSLKENSVITVEAFGYETYVWEIATTLPNRTIVMKQIPLFTGENSAVELPMKISEERRNIVGAVSIIKGEELESYSDHALSNALQGKGLGLVSIMNGGGVIDNSSTLYLRGIHRSGSNEILTIVDGIERPIDDVLPEEIEQIQLLKDATAKILYGARAANGILLVTTKRGVKHKRVIETSFESGIGLPTNTPSFLDSYEYAKLYNEARVNDGLSPIYSDVALEGYKNSEGENDLRYPNVDYYDYFLRDYTTYSKFSSEFSGGNEKTQYAMILGYVGSTGLEKIGTNPRNNRFSLRGNLDVQISENLSGFMDISGKINSAKRSAINHSTAFSRLSSHRPNEYPLVISEDYIEATNKGVPALGGSTDSPNNLLGSFLYSGYAKSENINAQMNFGLNMDLKAVAEGLSAKAFITFDNYFYGQEVLDKRPATYSPLWLTGHTGSDSVAFIKVQDEKINKNVTLGGNNNVRNVGWTGQLNYSRAFDNHNLNSSLGYFYYRKEISGASQDVENTNVYFRSNYSYKHKYIAEFNASLMGSNRFNKENKYRTFAAAGLGWVISEEDLFSDINWVDYLKIKTSYGVLGYDASTPYYLYTNRWYDNGNVQFGEKNSGTDQTRISLDWIGNPNLDWETSRELNVGVEGLLFNNRLTFDVNYFNELRDGIIQKVNSEYSSIYGGLYPYMNWGKVANNGIEAEVHWGENKGDFSYQIGGNIIWSKNEVKKKDEILYSEDYRRTIGKSSDVMIGYVSEGLFGKDVDLNRQVLQTLGFYGEGDIAYKDLNGDDEINDLDRKALGNSFPRAVLGFDISLNYKGWGFYVLGTAQVGVYKWLKNSYYANYGNGKYSVLASDRYHAINNPEGTYPRLTTTRADNNMNNSDFWIENTSFFRLKNVELSYTLSKIPVAHSVKIYTRGTNLFCISKVKDLDPEVINAGVSNYPVLSTITAGIAVSF
ncbi:TonB-linked outer membrane protein, SusC/RagA family [Mariniphaga anaerophila]|uniref:TonB-linked outer membrane protein, SusC/RagA family n=1 Tax=Mariniphaga anaerophila TaxID=1484053 RepID=A0A1M4V825_9BACT|nr:SusC/RagA family TonB-linked outer membrane protein [Mariniphaga anaerophila]SHE65082.1 TonB-linked outer membrane protein, SusC/RagA family [Mariniphaga anaerophila]